MKLFHIHLKIRKSLEKIGKNTENKTDSLTDRRPTDDRRTYFYMLFDKLKYSRFNRNFLRGIFELTRNQAINIIVLHSIEHQDNFIWHFSETVETITNSSSGSISRTWMPFSSTPPNTPRENNLNDLFILEKKTHRSNTKHSLVYLPHSPTHVIDLQSYIKSSEELNNSKMSKNTKFFYQKQNDLIQGYLEAEEIKSIARAEFLAEKQKHIELDFKKKEQDTKNLVLRYGSRSLRHYSSPKGSLTLTHQDSMAPFYNNINNINRAARISFMVNIFLVCIKLFAAIYSGSLAIIASLVDSFLDILSGGLIYFTSNLINKTDPMRHPEGREILEPIGVVIFSAIMGMASIELFSQSVQVLASNEIPDIIIDEITYSVLGLVIFCKLSLYFYCRKWRDLSDLVAALTQDHRNDVITNSVSFIMVTIASIVASLWYLDPLTAILISIYVIFTWIQTGKEQIDKLIGTTAPPEFLAKLTYLVMHHPEVVMVDSLRAYRIGPQGYLCEVDIVLPSEMPLFRAHDIGESLEMTLEGFNEVSRAFVHLDFETIHKPEYLRRKEQQKRKHSKTLTPKNNTIKHILNSDDVTIDLS